MTKEEPIIPELNLKYIIAESRDVANALNEFANELERIEKKYTELLRAEKESDDIHQDIEVVVVGGKLLTRKAVSE